MNSPKPRHQSTSRHSRRPRRLRTILLSTCALMILCGVADAGMAYAYRNRALPNTNLGQLHEGGASLTTLASMSDTIVLPTNFMLQDGATKTTRTPKELGLSVNVPASVHSRSTMQRWLPLISLVKRWDIPLQIRVDMAAYQHAGMSLASTFEQPALPPHIIFNGTTFTTAAAQTGHRLDMQGLITALGNAATHGTALLAVPMINIEAPKGTADLTGQIQILQKQLATKITLAYQGHVITPSRADIGRWYATNSQTMAPSKAAIAAYVTTVGGQLGITVANPTDLATGISYILDENLARNFTLVPQTSNTITRTYCTAVRDVNDSVLDDLSGKLAATYNDTRGWNNNGRIAFEQVNSGCQYTVWLAAASQMTNFGAICDDYYNCQVGTNVILNYDRWASATPPWNNTHGSLEDYHTLMIDHETGHRLGFLDNPTCPGANQSAPVMMQQSIDLKGCVFNIWPLSSEFAQLDNILGISINTTASSD